MQTFQLVPNSENGRTGIYIRGRNTRFTPDGRYLYVDADALNFLDTLGEYPPRAILHNVFGFAKNGALSVGYCADYGRTLIVTNLRTKKRVVRELDRGIGHGVVSADSKLLYAAVSVGLHDYEVRVFGVDSLRKRYSFGRCDQQLYQLTLSADDTRLANTNYYGFKIWDVTSKQSAARSPVAISSPNKAYFGFALSNDGSRLAAVNRKGLTIWDAATGHEVVRSGKHKRGVTAVACHPSKQLLTTGDNAGNVFLWDCTGSVLARFDWKLGEVNALCFAPDGLRCAAVDAKGKVVIWDIDE